MNYFKADQRYAENTAPLPWVFSGQPSTRWPRAVVGTNFAYDAHRILIHQFEGVLEIRLGDTLDRKATGEFFVVGKPEALQPDVSFFGRPYQAGGPVSHEATPQPIKTTNRPLADDIDDNSVDLSAQCC